MKNEKPKKLSNLALLRKQKGLTQDEMAKMFGKTRLAYAGWESGEHEPSIEEVKKLAAFFGTTVDHILDFNGQKQDAESIITPKKKTKCVIQFENCDYQELVKKLLEAEKSVDAIITDPPYGVSRDYQLGFSNMGRAGMNYGKWDYGFDQKEWIRLCVPVLKDGGSIIIFNDWKNLSYIVEALEEAGCEIKDLIRWVKKNPMPRNVNSRYVMDFEVAVWAVKGKKEKWTFHKPSGVPYIKPVYESGIVLGKKRIHPTQKPDSVIADIIKVHTNKKDLVFDPFSGSATTALSCLETGRNFIGSEIDPNYYEKAVKRLNESNFTFKLPGE